MTPIDLARRFVGTAEVVGLTANPMVLAMLRLDATWPSDDSVPWCAAFVNFIAWLAGLSRSTSLRARSWLAIGAAIPLSAARPGYDVVVFTREGATHDPSVLEAPGHVAWFLSTDGVTVEVLGGNQGDRVSVARFPVADVIGVRRLSQEA